jgi:hypothetical protein
MTATMSKVLSYCDRAGERLLWRGGIAHGVPQMRLPNGSKLDNVPRVAWRESGRSIPDGWVVVRTCGVEACVELEHLVCVENVMKVDRLRVAHPAAVRKSGRSRRTIHPLTVRAIKRAAERGEPLTRFVRRGISQAQVYGIANGFIYRDDDEPTPKRGTNGQYRRSSRSDVMKRRHARSRR